MELELRAILNEEAKTKLTEKREPSFYGGKPIGHNTEYYIGRTRVTIRQGVIHSEVPVLGPMSEEIKPYVAGFFAEAMMHEDILGVTRDKGKYALPDEEEKEAKQTTGTVEFYMKGTSKIICYGPDRERVLELYNLIRAGKIRPYEEVDMPQGGKSRAELEREVHFLHNHNTGLEAERKIAEEELSQAKLALKEGQELVDRISGERDEAKRDLEQAQQELAERRQEVKDLPLAQKRVSDMYKLAVAFDEGWWPFCGKKSVATRINLTLNGADRK